MNKTIKLTTVGAIIVVLFLVPLFISGPYQLGILILAGIAVILASSVRQLANSGLLSLAHGGMMSLGAYTAALLVTKLGLSSWLALLGAGVAAGLLAFLVAFPFLRLKGMYFALATVFLGQVIVLIIQEWKSLTGGAAGINRIPGPDPIVIPGLLNITFETKTELYYLVLVVMLIILAFLYALEHSRIGLTFFSIGQSETVAESVGINTPRYQILNFAIGCFFSGIAGGLYTQYVTAIAPSAFGFFWSIYIVIYMTVGGTASFFGPPIGAFLLTLIPKMASGLKEYEPFLFAAILILILFYMPEGLVGIPERLRKLFRKKK